MTRIFIEDNELDVDQGLSNQITYAIDDLNNLDSKMTAFSKTIILPGTTNNNTLLGNIFDFNNSNFTDSSLANVNYNFNASKAAKCRIECNGLQVIKGTFRLLEIVSTNGVHEYECAVFGELGGFVSAVGNLRIEDIDFSAYNHNYEVSGITSSWANAGAGYGYYYPLIDFGTFSTGAYGISKKDYQYKTFRPALFAREIIDKIITGAGYTWESNFFDTAFFKRLIIPNNAKDLIVPKNAIFYTNANPSYALSGVLSQASEVLSDGITLNSPVGGLFTSGDNKTFTYSGTAGSFNFGIIMAGNFSISFASGSIQVGPITISIKIELYKNGALEYSNGQTFGRSNPGAGTIAWNVSPVISMATSDTFEIHIETTVTRPSALNTTNYAVNITGSSVTIDTPVPVLSPAELHDPIVFNEILPKNIFQKDFFTSILKMFYLMVTEDKLKSKHLVIEPWVDFFDTTTSSYIDWSDKVDRGGVIRQKPMSEVTARYYGLKYKSDVDIYNDDYRKKYNEGYGDRVFDNNLDFAKDSDNVEVIFSSSVLTGYSGEDKVVPAIFKRNNGLEDRIQHNLRIMQAKKVTGVTSWDIMDGAIVLTSTTDYGYAGHLDDPDAPNADLNFGVPRELYFTLVSGDLSNNIFNAYYSPYFAEITDKDSRLLTVNVRLNEVDIYNLDFSKFIYIDGGLYRINKIVDYVPGSLDTTKVELLRVIYTTY